MSITYPPEMLPAPDEGDDAEVIWDGGKIVIPADKREIEKPADTAPLAQISSHQ
jgi:hypothetical protein